MKKIIFIDMDGVIANFKKAADKGYYSAAVQFSAIAPGKEARDALAKLMLDESRKLAKNKEIDCTK